MGRATSGGRFVDVGLCEEDFRLRGDEAAGTAGVSRLIGGASSDSAGDVRQRSSSAPRRRACCAASTGARRTSYRRGGTRPRSGEIVSRHAQAYRRVCLTERTKPLISTSGPPAWPPPSEPSSSLSSVRRREPASIRISPKKILPKSFTTTRLLAAISALGFFSPSHSIRAASVAWICLRCLIDPARLAKNCVAGLLRERGLRDHPSQLGVHRVPRTGWNRR